MLFVVAHQLASIELYSWFWYQWRIDESSSSTSLKCLFYIGFHQTQKFHFFSTFGKVSVSIETPHLSGHRWNWPCLVTLIFFEFYCFHPLPLNCPLTIYIDVRNRGNLVSNQYWITQNLQQQYNARKWSWRFYDVSVKNETRKSAKSAIRVWSEGVWESQLIWKSLSPTDRSFWWMKQNWQLLTIELEWNFDGLKPHDQI